ncbi:MAG TPA: methyltransferase domain-containing protein [Noviherbaspirillum sp.]|uniref:class I SAM-dependent methyltransferase n=1 Tax=Noviherbaspirillum sp. TaxID=1926288 RepID=UPI002B49E785|nr:methyltransferase domain-containing protein [Noviherbaspirillum sp.]HJV88516.1 methyltransferase domain-containing protein [Noviherbaspirillum sp.]
MKTENEGQERLQQEASAFDRQIEERIANGHIPDLRLSKPCEYFYNNSWRHPAYVKIDFYEQFEVIRDAILEGLNRKPDEIRVLEVGCGPGYLSLELSRAGFHVVGLDISERCVEIASKFADEDPWIARRGSLEYMAGDFHSLPKLEKESFDVVVFLGALHHFQDQSATLKKAKDLLRQHGLVIAHEPARDRVTPAHAAFMHLLSSILSLNKNFYKHQELVVDRGQLLHEVGRIYNLLRYESEDGEKTQSINDNEAGFAEMYPELSGAFQQIRFEWRYSFFHEFIGGLRFDEETNVRVARFLKEMDRILVETEALPATEFLFVGRKVMEV